MNKLSVEQIENWINEISEVNIEKGWRKEGLEIADFTANLHGEVSEAFEDYRNNHDINEVWYEYPGNKIYNEKKREICVDLNFNEYIEYLGKPCGIPSELSDIVIRALDMIGYYGWEKVYLDEFGKEICKEELERIESISFSYFISELHEAISLLFKESKESKDIDVYLINLDWLIKACFNIATKNNINLIEQINDKIAYNRTRPARHGGKRV